MPPLIAWGVLIAAAIAYEAWALIFHRGERWTLSEGVWTFTSMLAHKAPYVLTLLGFVLGVFFGHFFFCPCELGFK